MINCKDCKFWDIDSHIDKKGYEDSRGERRLGDCGCPKFITGYNYESKDIPEDGVWVENDEGWAFLTGPLFGCIHGEIKVE